MVDWPRSERSLVEAIIGEVNSETVLYSDKSDYLAFLGNLVKVGPLVQARKISLHALKWLTKGIQGRSLMQDSGVPLSTSQISGFNEFQGALLYLVEQCAIKCPDEVSDTLVEWLSLNATTFLPKHGFHVLRMEFALVVAAAKKSDQVAAILVGLAETTAQLSTGEKADDIVCAFENIILDSCVKQIRTAESKKKTWCITLLNQWRQRLISLSQHPSPEVRVNVAFALNRWVKSDLPSGEELDALRDKLAQDCRLRVRNAANPII